MKQFSILKYPNNQPLLCASSLSAYDVGVVWLNLDRMGKLNVALLRYLSREDFRMLTAVSFHNYHALCIT